MSVSATHRTLAGFEPCEGIEVDNLSIILCTYFSDHSDRPVGDAETESDDNAHWGDWVVERVDAYLAALANEVDK